MRHRIPRPSHATVVAYLALFVAMSGTAVAATGGTFHLGKGNRATHVSTLTNRMGVPLSLNARTDKPPLRVNSTTQVPRLNADLVDGLHARAFAKALCPNGPNDFMLMQTGCTHMIMVQGTISNTVLVPGHTAPGGVASCPPQHYAVGGGFSLAGAPGQRDTVVASFPFAPRYQAQSWIVEVAPNPANGGAVTPGSTVYVLCVGTYIPSDTIP